VVESPQVCVLLLNWRGWQDTIECLESVFRSSYRNYQVIVCDNHSSDGSWEQLQAWASGRLAFAMAGDSDSDTAPLLPKPVPHVTYDRQTAEAGGDQEADAARLILVQTGSNLGFSGGNNVALRYALARNDFSYVWLLNNDTLVTGAALAALVTRLEEQPDTGLCGSTLLYYHAPETVQVRGGVAYNRWFATMKPLGEGESIDLPFDRNRIERVMSYPSGASMLVTRDFLRSVGLLNEGYFLYYEELDWVTRAKGRFRLAYSPDSIIYHKHGRSIGTSSTDRPFDPADFYIHRNRLRYTYHFFPAGLPTTILRTLVAALARLWRRQPHRAWAIIQLIFSAETYAFPELITHGGKPPLN